MPPAESRRAARANSDPSSPWGAGERQTIVVQLGAARTHVPAVEAPVVVRLRALVPQYPQPMQPVPVDVARQALQTHPRFPADQPVQITIRAQGVDQRHLCVARLQFDLTAGDALALDRQVRPRHSMCTIGCSFRSANRAQSCARWQTQQESAR